MNTRPALSLLALAVLAACHPEPADTSSRASVASLGLPSASRVSLGPADATEGFLTALAEEDQAACQRHLSSAAREGFGNGSFGFSGAEFGTYTLGTAEVTGELARVPVHVVVEGETQEHSVLLRLEQGSWRVRGIAVGLGESEFTMDFEGLEDSLSGFGEAIAEGLADGMQEAFDASMAEWQAGGSAEEIAARRTSFDELESRTAEDSEAAWRIHLTGSAAAREFMDQVLARTGWSFEEGERGERFDEMLTLELQGVSRMEALEHIGQALGLVPVLPEPSYGETPQHLFTFREGPRTFPVTFAGPFAVEIVELEESVPKSRGSLRLRIAALGLDPSVQAMNGSMAEFVRIEAALSPTGIELRSAPERHTMGEPTVAAGLITYALDVDLIGLLSSVEAIESVRGEVHLSLPAEVHASRFEALATGIQTTGPWQVTCRKAGTNSNFILKHTGGELGDVEISTAFSADSEEGEPMGILWNSTSGYRQEYQAEIETPERPSALSLKICHVLTESYPFELGPLALPRHAEQPDRLERLAFRGEAPLTVRHLGAAQSSTPDFPQVRISVQCTANKDAESAVATFEYLDRSGTVLESFPHSLQGSFGFDGAQNLASASSSEEQDTAAFFMPPETAAVRIRVDEVSFVDGTSWSREP